MQDPKEEQIQFMRQALGVAEEALKVGELPIGAILVGGSEIIASAYARDKELKQRFALEVVSQ